MATVSITHVGEDVDNAFGLAMERADCTGIIRSGDRVLIKPNWNGCSIAASTKLVTVLAACRWACSQGAGEVIVGEGPVPVGRPRIDAYLAEMGALEALSRVGARFVLFDDDEHVIVANRDDLPREIGIAKLALTCDVLINIPMLKVHSCCLTTLCVKNLKGCLRPADKMAFHRIGLLPAVVAMNRLIPAHINLVDAMDAMEGNHNNGPLVPLGVYIAGRDRVATDAVASAAIGFESGTVPLLKMAANAGLGECDLDKIDIAGEPLTPQRLQRSQDHLRRNYPDLNIQEAGACSACSAALMDGLYTAGSARTVKSVALGPQVNPGSDALVIGNCTRKHWSSHDHVSGCPPDGAAIAKALQKDKADTHD
ncbi:MAG: DUF362 domain-containing protein [Candidatus Pacebacteria bacterium]|nr:DUF362 domain-containing protein [Candidatus Paceibacterota bacterium]